MPPKVPPIPQPSFLCASHACEVHVTRDGELCFACQQSARYMRLNQQRQAFRRAFPNIHNPNDTQELPAVDLTGSSQQ